MTVPLVTSILSPENLILQDEPRCEKTGLWGFRPDPTRNLNEVDPCDKDVWRSSVRSIMCAASQIPGREPTDVDDAPAPAH